MNEPRDLEFLVGGAGTAQQGGRLECVLVEIDSGASEARGVPAAPAGVQQIHQLFDTAQLHAPVLPPDEPLPSVSRSWPPCESANGT